MVIDDDRSISTIIKESLNKNKFENVLSVENGKDGIKIFINVHFLSAYFDK